MLEGDLLRTYLLIQSLGTHARTKTDALSRARFFFLSCSLSLSTSLRLYLSCLLLSLSLSFSLSCSLALSPFLSPSLFLFSLSSLSLCSRPLPLVFTCRTELLKNAFFSADQRGDNDCGHHSGREKAHGTEASGRVAGGLLCCAHGTSGVLRPDDDLCLSLVR